MSAQPNDRSAGQRSSDFTVPEFGPMDLFSEIDCAPPHPPSLDLLSRVDAPGFGSDLVGCESDLLRTWLRAAATEKIGREMDRQLRSRNDTREVVRRQGSGGAVSYKAQDQAGGVEIARAALGGDILSYTDTVSSRRNIRPCSARNAPSHPWFG